MKVIQRSTIVVPASMGAWLDTGLVVGDGESLHIQATGRVKWGGIKGEDYSDAFPEGAYFVGGDYAVADPASTLGYSDMPAEWDWPVTNTVPLGLSVAVVSLSSGNEPPVNPTSGGLRPNRDTTFEEQSGRVWVRFNGPADAAGTDLNKRLKGQFFVIVERLATVSVLPAPRGGRFVPLGLKRT